MKREQINNLNLPDLPGVYRFLKGKDILYIGKATSLRDRVKSYFSHDLIQTRGPLILKMVEESDGVTWETTDSVLEALILEANKIKQYKPVYNSKEKDDKSYNFITISQEDFPTVKVRRGREILLGVNGKGKTVSGFRSVFGPYPNESQLKEALKIVRKIFPYRDTCTPSIEKKKDTRKPCFNRQIGLCPGVCTGEISSREYMKTIRNIELFFQAKKEKIRSNLMKEMKTLASKKEFEKAEIVKKQLFSLDHIRDVSLLGKEKLYTGEKEYRIEAYDIAHISGKDTVGVMVVVSDGELEKENIENLKYEAGKEVCGSMTFKILKRYLLEGLIITNGSYQI